MKTGRKEQPEEKFYFEDNLSSLSQSQVNTDCPSNRVKGGQVKPTISFKNFKKVQIVIQKSLNSVILQQPICRALNSISKKKKKIRNTQVQASGLNVKFSKLNKH